MRVRPGRRARPKHEGFSAGRGVRLGGMAHVPVPPTLAVGERRVHRFQVLREHRADGSHEDWVVVGFVGDGIEVATTDFDWSRRVPVAAVAEGTFEPLAAGGVPVWGY